MSAAPSAARAQEDMSPTPSAVAETGTADPTTTDPDKYHLVMENQSVRVLRYHDVPGAKTHQHRHPDSVLLAVSAFRRRLHFPDGTTRDRDFQPGDVMWVPAQTHVGVNVGTTDTVVLLVEIKAPHR
jgi:quercetin dioxygenase-like cupin family protein